MSSKADNILEPTIRGSGFTLTAYLAVGKLQMVGFYFKERRRVLCSIYHRCLLAKKPMGASLDSS